VNTGYRSPKSIRSLHPSGYKDFLVYNVNDLKKLNPKIDAVRIAHTVGKRKKIEILVEARKKNLLVLNLKEAKLEDETKESSADDIKTEENQSETNKVRDSKESKKEKKREN
jgi:large subunit ribosomal protein L32e